MHRDPGGHGGRQEHQPRQSGPARNTLAGPVSRPSATVATSATAQLRIQGFAQEVDNVVGNKFPKLIVRINYSTEALGVAGI